MILTFLDLSWYWQALVVYAILFGVLPTIPLLAMRDWRAHVSHAVWFSVFIPVWFVSLPLTAIALLTPWDGRSLFCGNRKYGRDGNGHMPPHPTFFDRWWWMAIRNPISNFGKETLAVRDSCAWAWSEDRHILGAWWVKYGWKSDDPDIDGDLRTFVFRFWKHKQ